ncbi:E3 ubiquitin-protein ligase TRIM45-like [Mytilus trossulus]|uniref:E3 ubiquitin-protein ligase TRIM45-like n=1 Tax=Mytilus trossulus TaxID=6551 RepID=UPI0030044CF2
MAFSKSLRKGQIPVGCQLCEGGNKIEWKCTDCNLLMCDRCKHRVHLRIAKDHRIVNIQEIREHEDSWDRFVFSGVRCPDHTDQFCSLYCGTCNKIICLKCIVKVHNGHHFIDEEEFREKKEKLKEGQKKMKRNLTKVGSEKKKVIALEETDNAKLRNVKQNILDQRKQLHNAVDQYADNLVQDLDKHFSTLKHKETQIKKKIQRMHLNNDALENIITSRNFVQFFRDFDQLNIKLHEDMSQDSMNISPLPNFFPGEFTVLNFGSLEDNTRLTEHHSNVEFKVANQWKTEIMNIHYLVRCPDGSVCIADNENHLFQHIKLEKDRVDVISSFNIGVLGLDIISSNVLVSNFESTLQCID